MASFKTFTHNPLGSLTAVQITSPANKEWTVNPNVLSPHHSPKNVKQKNRSSQFLSKFNCPWKASILPSPSFCCTQSGFLQTRQTCCLFRTFSRPPLSFSASLSSFIECTLPAKKHNCFCHIITELFYSHVQIGILLGVYMPSN